MKKIISLILVFLLSNSIIFMPELQFIKADSTDCDWTMYGRTLEHNLVVPDGCGPNSENLVSIWEFRLDDIIGSTITASEDRLFFGSDDHKVYCINVVDGSKIWEFKTKDIVNSSVNILDGKAVFSSYDGNIYCLNSSNGRLIWSYKAGKSMHSSPMIYNNKVYIGSRDGQDGLLCLDFNNGKLVWKYEIEMGVFSTPSIAEGKIVFGAMFNLYCLDANTGKKYWNFNVKQMIENSALIMDGKVYFGTTPDEQINNLPIIRFYCLDLNNGKKIWDSLIENDVFIFSNPVYFNKYIFINSWESNLYCINGANGKIEWIYNILQTGERGWLGEIVVYKDKLYFGNPQGDLLIFDINSRSILKKLNLGNDSIFEIPLIFANRIYVAIGSKIICLGDEPSKPTRLQISNSNTIIDPCMNELFSAKVYDQYGKIIENQLLNWSVSDNDIAEIDSNGLLKAKKQGIITITCRCRDLLADKVVEVKKYLYTQQEHILLDNVIPNQKYTKSLYYTNQSNRKLEISLLLDSKEASLNTNSITLEKYQTKEVTLSYQTIDIKYSRNISFNVIAKYLECSISSECKVVIISDPECFKVKPDLLNFGYTPRGSTKTLDLVISSVKPIKVKIVALESWINLSKKELDFSTSNNIIIKVEVLSSAIPSGEIFSSKIQIIPSDSLCNKLDVPVAISTDKGIIVSLTVSSNEAKINNKLFNLDVPAQIINGRTMVPLRFITEAFGCEVKWDPTEGKITIIRHSMVFYLWKGKNIAIVNDVEQKLDSPPVIVGGRTLVPLRFISEPFGAKVNWEAKTKTITIIWEPN